MCRINCDDAEDRVGFARVDHRDFSPIGRCRQRRGSLLLRCFSPRPKRTVAISVSYSLHVAWLACEDLPTVPQNVE